MAKKVGVLRFKLSAPPGVRERVLQKHAQKPTEKLLALDLGSAFHHPILQSLRLLRPQCATMERKEV